MHDRTVVIGADIQCETPRFLVILSVGVTGVVPYPEVGISIISLMLMPEPDRMADLMSDRAWAAVFLEPNLLLTADHA